MAAGLNQATAISAVSTPLKVGINEIVVVIPFIKVGMGLAAAARGYRKLLDGLCHEIVDFVCAKAHWPFLRGFRGASTCPLTIVRGTSRWVGGLFGLEVWVVKANDFPFGRRPLVMVANVLFSPLMGFFLGFKRPIEGNTLKGISQCDGKLVHLSPQCQLEGRLISRDLDFAALGFPNGLTGFLKCGSHRNGAVVAQLGLKGVLVANEPSTGRIRDLLDNGHAIGGFIAIYDRNHELSPWLGLYSALEQNVNPHKPHKGALSGDNAPLFEASGRGGNHLGLVNVEHPTDAMLTFLYSAAFLKPAVESLDVKRLAGIVPIQQLHVLEALAVKTANQLLILLGKSRVLVLSLGRSLRLRNALICKGFRNSLSNRSLELDLRHRQSPLVCGERGFYSLSPHFVMGERDRNSLRVGQSKWPSIGHSGRSARLPTLPIERARLCRSNRTCLKSGSQRLPAVYSENPEIGGLASSVASSALPSVGSGVVVLRRPFVRTQGLLHTNFRPAALSMLTH